MTRTPTRLIAGGTVRLLAGAALLSLAAPMAARAQLTAGAPTGLTPVTLPGAPGQTYPAGATATSTTGGATFSFSSNTNPLESDVVGNGFDDSNFAAGTQLIGPCGEQAFLSCNAASSLRITFSVPTTGFSFGADDFDTSQAYTFTAQAFSGATSLGTVTASSLSDNGQSPAILAGASATPITSLLITDVASSGNGDGDFAVGNLAVVGTAVPEPGSVAGLATGLLAALALTRRKTRNA